MGDDRLTALQDALQGHVRLQGHNDRLVEFQRHGHRYYVRRRDLEGPQRLRLHDVDSGCARAVEARFVQLRVGAVYSVRQTRMAGWGVGAAYIFVWYW